MGEPLTDREMWAEQEAIKMERSAAYLLEEYLPGWIERGARVQHPDAYRACYEIALKAQIYKEIADQLRRPRYIREDQEAYKAFYDTPDRSGEADKTEDTGLAEGESGLPEGSS